MIFTHMFHEADAPLLRSFVGGMINEWLDQSSMQADVICCPDRTIANVLERYERAINGEALLILAKDGERQTVVGTLVLEREQRWLRYAEAYLLNIHPEYRRRGVGRKLIGQAMCALRRQRVKKVTFKTWEGNEPALAAFSRAGGLVTERQEGRSVTTESWLPMVLSTLNAASVDLSVQDGDYNASAMLDAGVIHMGVSIGEHRCDFAIIPT